MKQTDVLIIGSGIGGLSLALQLHRLNSNLEITVLAKAEALESNSRYAQGGIAAVLDLLNDSYESHIQDTLNCGGGLCAEEVVKWVVEHAPARIKELMDWGVEFDQHVNGTLALGLEGGHTRPRIAHVKDKTGFEIQSVLLWQIQQCKQIKLLQNVMAVDLFTQRKGKEKKCRGVEVYNPLTHQKEVRYAKIVVLATGGCGQVFLNTTNPSVATGDGYAMAERAGALFEHMRFVQFHPTALYQPKKEGVSFLISEALRGYGAYIVDDNTHRFLFEYDQRGELATRDVISAAILNHMKENRKDCVYLDMRHLDPADCKAHFPMITEKLESCGFDFAQNLIPIVPSAHYQCGGIAVDKNGRTNIQNLYALGEVTHTGLHGANRLASNSLLEALVFAHDAANHIHEIIASVEDVFVDQPPQKLTDEKGQLRWIEQERNALKKIMSSNFFTLQEPAHLISEAITTIEQRCEWEWLHLHYAPELLELRNMATTARLIMNDRIKHHLIVHESKMEQV